VTGHTMGLASSSAPQTVAYDIMTPSEILAVIYQEVFLTM